MKKIFTAFVLFLILSGCRQNEATIRGQAFEKGTSLGEIQDKALREVSGIIASRNNPGFLWVHNDSGHGPDIFLINTKGEVKCTVHLSGVKNRDWEDIAVGTEGGKNYVYAAEIGDNNAAYKTKFLFRVEEPVIGEGVTDTTIHQVDQIEFELSDGARDTEALTIDPVSKDVYILSKRENRVNLYKLAAPLSTTGIMTAEKVVEKLPFSLAVAADISEDGTEILVKNYDNVFYWKRSAGESVEDALKRAPERLPYEPEPQGEAITFDHSGKGYYTLSEKNKKIPQHLLFYKRK